MNSNASSPLKLMIVDQSPDRRNILEKILRKSGYVNIFATSGIEDLYSMVSQIHPDVVLIELESPNRDTLEQLKAIRREQPLPVVMFASDHDVQTVRAAVDSGVCAYLCDHVDPSAVKPAIALAMATFDAYRKVRKEADKYRLELDSRKRIDRAKAVLIKERGISEGEAHRTIRKMAMDQNQKLSVIAEQVILGHKPLG